jgi:hypothetical protein
MMKNITDVTAVMSNHLMRRLENIHVSRITLPSTLENYVVTPHLRIMQLVSEQNYIK